MPKIRRVELMEIDEKDGQKLGSFEWKANTGKDKLMPEIKTENLVHYVDAVNPSINVKLENLVELSGLLQIVTSCGKSHFYGIKIDD